MLCAVSSRVLLDLPMTNATVWKSSPELGHDLASALILVKINVAAVPHVMPSSDPF